MKYWFTADYHLGHGNILIYCNRPFKNISHMNSEIIRRHNERVKSEDIVFHIGDFCFKNTSGGKQGEGSLTKAKEWEELLNGKIIHIKGNHDRNNSTKTIIESLQIKFGGKYINLVHDPKFVNSNFKFNFVGHVHNHWKFKQVRMELYNINLINVGVDVWDFMPVTFEEIMKKYYQWVKSNSVNF